MDEIVRGLQGIDAKGQFAGVGPLFMRLDLVASRLPCADHARLWHPLAHVCAGDAHRFDAPSRVPPVRWPRDQTQRQSAADRLISASYSNRFGSWRERSQRIVHQSFIV